MGQSSTARESAFLEAIGKVFEEWEEVAEKFNLVYSFEETLDNLVEGESITATLKPPVEGTATTATLQPPGVTFELRRVPYIEPREGWVAFGYCGRPPRRNMFWTLGLEGGGPTLGE
jgi:hypothetical protein